MKKIVFVIPNLEYGGAQKMLVHILRCISYEKYKPYVVVRDYPLNNSLEEELKTMPIFLIFLKLGKPSSLNARLKGYLRFEKSINNIEPDLIHVHLESIYSYTYAIVHKIPIVTTIHSWPDRIAGKRMQIYTRILSFKRRLWIVGCADCVSNRLREIFACLDRRISTIYNPVCLDEFKIEKKENESDFVYLHIGRLTAIKNQRLLINTFSEILTVKEKSKLLIVGSGELEIQLRRLVDDLGISDKVFFLGNRSDIPKLLTNANVMVMTSDSECCPMVILESMAAGTPVISTEVGGVPELIQDCGILVPKGDSHALKMAMISVQEDQNRMKQLELNSRICANNYADNVITKQYEALYDMILKGFR